MARSSGLTFSDAIEKVLMEHGGYAPLRIIYRDFSRFRDLTGKTPIKTIQERVQRDPRFTRIGLGVYALRTMLGRLPKAEEPKSENQRRHFHHTRFQGMLVELGNLDGYDTYTADPGRVFDNKRLGSITSLPKVPAFTYPQLVSTARYIDVLWFNERRFPERAFEVEYSTNFRNSLVKFTDLQDFNIRFYLVAPSEGRSKYDREIGRAAFERIAKRCAFWAFEKLEKFYQSRVAFAEAATSLEESSLTQ